MLAGLVSSEASFLGMWMTIFSLCLHTVFRYTFVSRFLLRGTLEVLVYSTTLEALFQLNYFFKDTVSVQSYTELLKVRIQLNDFFFFFFL
jgi:hypothetical protein